MRHQLLSALILILAPFTLWSQFKMELTIHPRYIPVTSIQIYPYNSGTLIKVETNGQIDSAFINEQAKLDIADLFSENMMRTDTAHSILNVYVIGKYENEGDYREFEFNRPNRNTPEHHLIALLWTIMYAVIDDDEITTTLERTEDQFDFGFGLKKLSDDPLTFKLYGRITGKDSKQLSEFIDSIPTEDTVIFHMENFLNMGRVYYPAFRQLAEKNNNIFWLNCSPKTRTHLLNSGTPYQHIELKKK